LTFDEQLTQMVLWSMAKSPLMYGGDLRHLNDDTFDLITHPTLLKINHHTKNNMEVNNILLIEVWRFLLQHRVNRKLTCGFFFSVWLYSQ
uniref:Uncharacterized protein n=1 Tax=Aegilops tauschii subsp. strangulata TaxID=200361 RepID=A0A453PJF5_AEGTS